MNTRLRKRLEALEHTPGSLLARIRDGLSPPKRHIPLIVSGVVGAADLNASRCTRTLFPDGTLWDYVWLDDGHGKLASTHGLSDEELNDWIESFPIELG